ncbi:MAG: hypothetical protein BYD32DRAFT_412484 [Podila humilis]|nr:MAG: hypothetical protein BYD32DRAFT_412484 [Podila humilis]
MVEFDPLPQDDWINPSSDEGTGDDRDMSKDGDEGGDDHGDETDLRKSDHQYQGEKYRAFRSSSPAKSESTNASKRQHSQDRSSVSSKKDKVKEPSNFNSRTSRPFKNPPLERSNSSVSGLNADYMTIRADGICKEKQLELEIAKIQAQDRERQRIHEEKMLQDKNAQEERAREDRREEMKRQEKSDARRSVLEIYLASINAGMNPRPFVYDFQRTTGISTNVAVMTDNVVAPLDNPIIELDIIAGTGNRIAAIPDNIVSLLGNLSNEFHMDQ